MISSCQWIYVQTHLWASVDFRNSWSELGDLILSLPFYSNCEWLTLLLDRCSFFTFWPCQFSVSLPDKTLLKEMSSFDHHYTSGSHLKLNYHCLADLSLQLSEEYLENFFLGFLAAKFKQCYFTDPKPVMTCFMKLPWRKLSPIVTITGLYRMWSSWRTSFLKWSVAERDIFFEKKRVFQIKDGHFVYPG